MTDEPNHRRTRIVLCMGEYCNLGRRADKLRAILEPAVAAANAGCPMDQRRFKFETARCLSMCAVGPNCVVYPQDDVYNKLTPESLQEIVDTFLAQTE